MAKQTKAPESDPARTQAEPAALPPPRPTTSIAEGLLVAQRALGQVVKGSKNAYHGYKYTSTDDMIAACRDALHHGGLTVHKIKHDIAAPSHEIANAIDPDNPPFYLMVTSHFELVHEAGERARFEFQLPAAPEKGRPLDKAILGTLTTSLGYFLRDLLQVPREDQNEIDQRDDSRYEKPQRQPGSLRKPDLGGTKPAASGRGQHDPEPELTPKQKMWSLISAWSGIPGSEAADLAGAGKRIFTHLKIDATGKATEADFERATAYIQKQRKANIDFAEWANDPAAQDEAEGRPVLTKEGAQTDGIDDSDIPY